jgi:hypothetical protein
MISRHWQPEGQGRRWQRGMPQLVKRETAGRHRQQSVELCTGIGHLIPHRLIITSPLGDGKAPYDFEVWQSTVLAIDW